MSVTNQELEEMEKTLKQAFKNASSLFNHYSSNSDVITAVSTTAQALLTVDREIRERKESGQRFTINKSST